MDKKSESEVVKTKFTDHEPIFSDEELEELLGLKPQEKRRFETLRRIIAALSL